MPANTSAPEIVRTVVPGCSVEYADGAVSDPRSYRVDFSKLGRAFPDLELGWNAAAGAKDLFAALRAAGITLADFQGRTYIRLAQIKHLLDDGRLDPSLRWTSA